MTCEEFERVLSELEGGRNIEQQSHLRTCSMCSDLLSDLNAISQQAGLLVDNHEPSPRLWNSIETALRQEGLIRQTQPQPSSRGVPRLRVAWLAPVLTAMVIAVGLLLYQHGTEQPQLAQREHTPSPVANNNLPAVKSSNLPMGDEQFLKTMAAPTPRMRAAYESDLQAVEAYIRDAEASAQSDPNDEVAQQYLTNAYEQKAMVYELAMDRSLR